MHLNRALDADDPLRLVIKGRYLRPPLGRALDINDLAMVRLPAARLRGFQLAVHAVGPYRIELIGGDERSRRDPEELDTDWRNRLTHGPIDLLLALSAEGTSAGMALRPEKPRYAAEVEVEATYVEGAIQEHYHLRCQPEATHPVGRLLVRLSTSHDVPPEWTLISSRDARRLVAKRLKDAAQSPAQGELWELLIEPPSEQPIEIRGSRNLRAVDSKHRIALLALPEATSQRGKVLVRGLGDSPVRIVNHSLTPTPVPYRSGQAMGIVRACFGYEEIPLGDDENTGHIVLEGLKSVDHPVAVIWDADLHSQYKMDGGGEHVARFLVQNFGLTRMRIQLPDATDIQTWIDGARTSQERSADGKLTIPLRDGVYFPVVTVTFRTNGQPFGLLGQVNAPILHADIPVLHRSVTIGLPPELEIREGASGWRCDQIQPLSWSQRLFGPLGRRPGEKPFDLLNAAHWRSLVELGCGIHLDRRASEPLLEHAGKGVSQRCPGRCDLERPAQPCL